MEIKKFLFNNHNDARGNLVPIEAGKDIPFEIKRIYYMYDVDSTARRGFHAHKSLEQALICLQGTCKILLDDGKEKQIVTLDKNDEALYVGSMIWREMYDFSEKAVLLVLASEFYDKDDYISDYEEFLRLALRGIGESKL